MIFQFIVNDMLIQSLSMRAVSGCALALKSLIGPQMRSRDPLGLVWNRKGVFRVMIPSQNGLWIHSFQFSPATSNRNSMDPGALRPLQIAVKPTGFLIHQPVWLAMVSGRQR